ncbi:MAG TPA: hypothetical protein VFQ53_24385 [Kofleriaceae bacterium]|nr:hypothetical protein [Kofleriaceae bacterium]
MRLAWIAVAVIGLGCGSKSHHPAGPSVPAVARAYPAARWIPAKPTYVLASKTVREGQRALVDVIDSLSPLTDFDVAIARRLVERFLAVDALSPDAVAAIGIDVEGGGVVFSEGVSPTLVVHVAAPDQLQAFFQQQRDRGLHAQSQIVDGAELFTVQLEGKTAVSWVAVDDWLWVHIQLPVGTDTGTSWFTASHRPAAATWTADWDWASAGKEPTLLGFFDVRGALAKLSERVPEAIACTQLLAPVSRSGFSVDSDGRSFRARFALDVGASGASIQAAVLPPPEGWSAVTGKAPLAAAWNLDLEATKRWLAPCAAAAKLDLAALPTQGVRAARVVLQSFDPDDKSGAGAVALDVTSKRALASLLDQIPLRSKFESTAKFGPYTGKHLSIPFGPKLDYVLTDQVAFAAMGEGLLARLVGNGGPARTPSLLAIDLWPANLSREAWLWLLEAIDLPAPRITDQLMRWREVHIAVAIDGPRLVIDLAGARK